MVAAPKSIPANPNLVGEVTIGAVLPLTGDGAAYGLPEQKAIQLAVDEINAGNGIGGKKLSVFFEDGKCDEAKGKAAVTTLVNHYQVPAIIGGACSSETLGMAVTANEKKTVVISPSATAPELTNKGGVYVYRLAPSDAREGHVAAQYAAGVDVKAKRAAVLSEMSDTEQALRRAFVNEFKAQGGKVVFDESYVKGAMEFRAQALRIQRTNPDVIYVVPQGSSTGLEVVKTLKEMGVTARIITTDALLNGEKVKEHAALLEGIISFEAMFDETNERGRSFINAYKERYAEEVSFPLYMANAYTAVYLLKDAMGEGGVTGVQIKAKLDKLKDWTGAAHTEVAFNEFGDIAWRDYRLLEAVAGTVIRHTTYQAP
jgi:branched-chain amino acid transport system substrate-binding protein